MPLPLDLLDPVYVKQAELLALSTTLATNACLEDKGSRAKILMIGMNPGVYAQPQRSVRSLRFPGIRRNLYL